jgi:superfamily I DNA/RNA helicase
MDLQQEQLARSLGEGHRVIHGAAGSGKTMILGYRAQHLVKAVKKPILLLCCNVALAARLRHMIAQKELAEHVSVYTFHAWCREQLRLYHLPPPQGEGDAFSKALVETVIAGVEQKQIPPAQYGAVLIDEAHDFETAWLQLAVQMVDPDTNSLLVLYDDAQSLYGAGKRSGFSFARVGIQARGRTTILRLNYRNTDEVLALAREFAREILAPAEAGEDGIPLVSPESAGRHGPLPEVLGFPDFQSESRFVVERLRALHDAGVAWGEMAVVYRTNFIGERLVEALREARVPADWLGRGASQVKFRPDEDRVKVMTMHAAKGLEFPVVIVPGIGYLPHPENDPVAEARLLYVAMTRATERLILSHHADSPFAMRLQEAVRKVA